MIRYILIYLLITFGCLYSHAENRDFQYIYHKVDSLLNESSFKEVSVLFKGLKKKENQFTETEVYWLRLIHAKILQKTVSQKEAGILLFENLRDVELSKDTNLIFNQYFLIGDLSNEYGEEYLLKANEICSDTDYLNKGKIYYHIARVKCSDSSTVKTCLDHYHKALTYSKKAKDFRQIAKIYNNISAFYYDQNLQNKNSSSEIQKLVEVYADSSIYIRAQLNNPSFMASGLINKALNYRDKDPDVYLNLLNKAKNLNVDSTDYSFYCDLYFNLADAYELNGNDSKALEILFSYTHYSDLKSSSFKEKDLLKSVASYEYKQLQSEIKIAESLATIKSREANVLKWLIGLGALVFCLVVGVLMKNGRLKRENHKLEIRKNNLLAEKRVQEVKSHKKSEILHASLDAREEERKSISEVLHNSVSAILSSANLHLTVLNKKTNIDSKQEYKKTKQLLMEASDKVRDISHELVSPALQKFGLQAAITDLCEKYSNEFLNLECDVVDLNPRPSLKMETKVFRIIEELINNIIKHSEASEASIVLEKSTNFLSAKISDNGKGFSMSQFQNSKSLGIQQIKLIVSFYGGSFTISGNDGTEVDFNIPTSALYQQAEA